jgi:hypothetical protein
MSFARAFRLFGKSFVTLPGPFRRACGSDFRLGRVAVVGVFLLTAATVDRAQASCGDWLAGHETMSHPLTGESGEPRLPVPCNGPNCRRSHDQLPIVPSAPSRQFDGPERWCRLVEELASQPSLSTLLPPTVNPSPLRGFEPRIERPPRV